MCFRSFSRLWGYSSEQSQQSPCPQGASNLVAKTSKNQLASTCRIYFQVVISAVTKNRVRSDGEVVLFELGRLGKASRRR